MQFYTIGIKDKFWFKKYKVSAHWCEGTVQDADGQNCHFPLRLCLKLLTGDVLILPNIALKTWKIYADYNEFMATKPQPQAKLAEEQ